MYLTMHLYIYLSIREVPISSLGSEAGSYHRMFSSPSVQIPVLYFKIGHDRFLPHPLQVIILKSSCNIRRYIT